MFGKLLQDPVGFLAADPFWQSVLVPFATALVIAAALRSSGGPEVGRRTAAFGVGAGFLMAYLLIAGRPAALSMETPAGKLFWIAAAGLALGFALDLAGWAERGRGLAFLVSAAALLWLAGTQHEALQPVVYAGIVAIPPAAAIAYVLYLEASAG
jgi:hypothetical protein